MRMRQRLARLGAPKAGPLAVLDPLITIVKTTHPHSDIDLIERAYRTAEHYHHGQTRKSGDAYITHPLAVSTILAELGMTQEVIAAGMLHDTVEDTSYELPQLKADFGEEIALLVDGVTKMDKVEYGANAPAETIRKMLVRASKDQRVLIIKLADRLHNMRTIGFLRPDKQERIARETLNVYAPIANRLGMNAVKGELEDLSFAAVEPKIYDSIVNLVTESAPERDQQIKVVIDQVKERLAAEGLPAIVYGRPKRYYSIYQKMVNRNKAFEDIYDLVGIRIILEDNATCYGAMGLVHGMWTPLPGRIKDYIARHKDNYYQSLHTTVIGPEGRPVEFQIRTQEMHRTAEYGVAAHWKYKQNLTSGRLDKEEELRWMHSLSELTQGNEDPMEALDWVMAEINAKEIFINTPKGDTFTLPEGATPVDMAYHIHSQVGERCIGARVNGRLVPLSSKLETGDTVEILVSKATDAGPSRDWLNFVVSPRTKSKIRQYFSRSRRDEATERGKEILAKQLRKTGTPIHKLLTTENLTSVADSFRYPDIQSLYVAIGEGQLNAPGVVAKLIAAVGGEDEAADEMLDDRPVISLRPRSKGGEEAGVVVDGDASMMVKLARCCTPLPGDEILGFITRESGVSIHRVDCTNADNLKLQPERLVNVAWAMGAQASYDVSVQVEALDRPGLLADVTKSLSDQRVNISAVTVRTGKDRLARINLTFEAADPKHLSYLLNLLRRVPGVTDVFRLKQ
jgi:GTP pyrophosphokinase